MAIHPLTCGYYVKVGAATVIDSPNSSYNSKKIADLVEFGQIFWSRREALSEFLEWNPQRPQPDFQIAHDVKTKSRSMLNTLTEKVGKFSIVVNSTEKDLLHEPSKQAYIDPEIMRRFARRVEKFQIQIFSLDCELYPLTPGVLQQLGDKLPFYLMDNAIRVEKTVARWLGNYKGAM